MSTIPFRPLALGDSEAVMRQVWHADCRNCDYNFMNLMSWRFLFGTELAFHENWLFIRFRSGARLAYLPPVGSGDWADILPVMRDDAHSLGEQFRLMGVCPHSLERLEHTMPCEYVASTDRNAADYLYLRDSLASLTGKKLQPKRNHINRFVKEYPDFSFRPLTAEYFDECIRLADCWRKQKGEPGGWLTPEQERESMQFVFEHWSHFCGKGGTLWVGDRLVAFTYGAPINRDTFDVCMEKADTDFDGAYAVINREFVRTLPEHFIYVNREEDLGIEGLRKAKLSYQPEIILNKYTVEEV